MVNMDRLQNKVALITGAAGGIGQASALRFAREGARIVALDRNTEALSRLAAEVEGEGGAVLALPVDLTESNQVHAAVTHALDVFGRLDAVFNTAGGSGRRMGDGPVDQCTEEGWNWTIELNLTSMFLVCKHAMPALLESKGAVVNLSSVLGVVGGDEDFTTHAYAAAKAGIIGLSRAMASTYATRGVRVNVIAPGLIATPMSQRAQTDPHILNRLPQLQPLTGTFGTPEDIAATAAFLASDDARFITGAVLTVDGGWTVR